MEPCPGCSLGWFSGRESGGGKAHLCFFLGQYIPGLRVYSHLFPVKRQGRTCLVLLVLPGLQWQGGFWQLMCDPVLQLCCTLIPGTLCLPSHPFESHLHLQFSLSQSPLRLLNSSEYQNYRGKKSVLQKPAAISSSSSPAQFSTHGSRKTKLILIHNRTSTAHSCNICPYLE